MRTIVRLRDFEHAKEANKKRIRAVECRAFNLYRKNWSNLKYFEERSEYNLNWNSSTRRSTYPFINPNDAFRIANASCGGSQSHSDADELQQYLNSKSSDCMCIETDENARETAWQWYYCS
jgi:hypothetical protein